MRLILVGPPGSGKGTQAKLLSQRNGLAHISTGDILREGVRLGTPAGKKAEPFMASGKLAPDVVVNELVAERFQRADRPERFLLDGYPRTLAQATALDGVLCQLKLAITDVLYLMVPDDVIIERCVQRRICPKDQTPYHLQSKPPRQPGVCDQCGTALVQRPDDREETVRERLRIYHQNTAELIPYYRQQGLLREVIGTGAIEQIYQQIVQSLTSSRH